MLRANPPNFKDLLSQKRSLTILAPRDAAVLQQSFETILSIIEPVLVNKQQIQTLDLQWLNLYHDLSKQLVAGIDHSAQYSYYIISFLDDFIPYASSLAIAGSQTKHNANDTLESIVITIADLKRYITNVETIYQHVKSGFEQVYVQVQSLPGADTDTGRSVWANRAITHLRDHAMNVYSDTSKTDELVARLQNSLQRFPELQQHVEQVLSSNSQSPEGWRKVKHAHSTFSSQWKDSVSQSDYSNPAILTSAQAFRVAALEHSNNIHPAMERFPHHFVQVKTLFSLSRVGQPNAPANEVVDSAGINPGYWRVHYPKFESLTILNREVQTDMPTVSRGVKATIIGITPQDSPGRYSIGLEILIDGQFKVQNCSFRCVKMEVIWTLRYPASADSTTLAILEPNVACVPDIHKRPNILGIGPNHKTKDHRLLSQGQALAAPDQRDVDLGNGSWRQTYKTAIPHWAVVKHAEYALNEREEPYANWILQRKQTSSSAPTDIDATADECIIGVCLEIPPSLHQLVMNLEIKAHYETTTRVMRLFKFSGNAMLEVEGDRRLHLPFHTASLLMK
ncbi:hypothetical protein CVT24_001840 [Panaeolus cyanescens]|uniref:Uncharacterized protein n=1 Tax=Panaeolus cyanescens TaxID=181874 RepID=A0A409YET2_9AGAR|nr:hypothetical protein CVT24_001840 [Panaeolus cyanescens]